MLSPLSSHATAEDTNRQHLDRSQPPTGDRHFKSQPVSASTLREHPATCPKYQSGTSALDMSATWTAESEPLDYRFGSEQSVRGRTAERLLFAVDVCEAVDVS